MSTRGAIARLKDNESWEGRYHHWDSYPSGLGATLFQLIRSEQLGDLKATLTTLLDDHPAGWSTINGADWSLTAGFPDDEAGPCAQCGKEMWEHYAQYYEAHGLPEPPHPPDSYAVLGHPFDRPRIPQGAQCYCHGSRGEDGQLVTNQNASAIGVEYAYVFDVERARMLVLSSYTEGGQKMIGMFGMGDPDARWGVMAEVDLTGPEPNWEAIEEAA